MSDESVYSVRLPRAIVNRAKAVAERLGWSMADVFKRAIASYDGPPTATLQFTTTNPLTPLQIGLEVGQFHRQTTLGVVAEPTEEAGNGAGQGH